MIGLLGTIAFFGLTRTEVGRDQLRQTLVDRFNASFAGSLEVKTLQGNLVNDLYASDVRVLSPAGDPVITVDSVTIRPRWTELFRRELSLQTLVLHAPQVHAHRDRAGTWSVQRAFERTTAPDGEASLRFALVDVRIRDARITTTRDGEAPEIVRDDWLFDFTQSRIQDFNARATVDWGSDDQLIEAYNVSFEMPGRDVRVAALQGQVAHAEGVWSIRQSRISTGATDVRFAGTIPSATARKRTADETRTPDPVAYDIVLGESRIDFDEMRRLSPRLPLSDLVTVRGRASGPLSSLLIEDFQVRHGRSQVQLRGTALGLPDSLDYDVRVLETELFAEDLDAVWRHPLPAAIDSLQRTKLSIFSEGVLRRTGSPGSSSGLADFFDAFDVRATIDADTDVGGVDAEVMLRQPGQDTLTYTADIRLDSLDLAPVTGRQDLRGAVSGLVTVGGEGMTVDRLNTEVTARLRRSRIGSQRIDTAAVDATVIGRVADVRLAMQQDTGGRIEMAGRFDGGVSIPAYELKGTTRDFDLGALPSGLPATSLNATVALTGRGRTWGQAAGGLQLRVDSSTIARAGTLRPVAPHRVSVRLAPAGARDEPRVRIDGDVVSLTAAGDLEDDAVAVVARLWAQELADAVRREVDKPIPQPLADAAGLDAPGLGASPLDAPPVGSAGEAAAVRIVADAPAPDGVAPDVRPDAPIQGLPPPETDAPTLEKTKDNRRTQRRLQARTALSQRAQQRPVEVRVTAEVRNAEILRTWLPVLPPVADGLQASIQAVADADSMSVRASAGAPSYTTGGVRADSLRIETRMNASLDRPLVKSISATIDVFAESVAAGSLSVAQPAATVTYDQAQGALRLRSQREGRVGPFAFDATLDVRPNRNTLTIETIYASVGDIVWSNSTSSVVDLYRDAVVVEPLTLESPRPETDGFQRVEVVGRLSPAPDDRLIARAENVLLYPVSDLLRLTRPIAGRLDGTVEMSGRWREPLVRASFDVGRFSFDRRQLGRVGLSFTYDTSTPDIVLEADLQPDTTSAGPSLLPDGIRRVENNRLRIDGRFRLPTAEADTMAGDPLDLNLNVSRADLFFFEYIFEDTVTKVEGFTTGTAHIGGSFTSPLFDADMRVENGAFSLPDFNLRYSIDGDVRVDRSGIHLAGVRVGDGDDGVADIDGSVLFNEYRFFSFDLAAQLREMLVIDVEDSDDLPFYGTIRASGPASLTGPLPDATLRSPQVQTTPNSELFIPVAEEDVAEESGYIIFADSTGALPDLTNLTQRDNLLSDRPVGEPSFLDGLELDLNIQAPEGSTVHLVFDPLVGDVVTAVGAGRVQLQRQEGEFFVYGSYEVSGGNYLFTAGEVFVRRFSIDGGTLTWDGDPVNAQMDLSAAYRTRASPAGLPNEEQYAGRIPVIVELDITGRVETPRVDLSLSVARDQRSGLVGDQTLDAILNQDDLATEYATSVLLTNTFLLTTSTLSAGGASGEQSRIAEAGNQLAFNSVSQLVASQLNRYLSEALPNVDVNLGVSGEDPEDLDVIYGVALRLLNERLIIRGEGVYTGNEPDQREVSGPQGEFVVEVRLSRSVSLEVFYRRTGDDVTRQTLTNTTGAGLSYQNEFSTWKRLFYQLFGWLLPGDRSGDSADDAGDRSPGEDAEGDAEETGGEPPIADTPAASPPTDRTRIRAPEPPASDRPGAETSPATRDTGGQRRRR